MTRLPSSIRFGFALGFGLMAVSSVSFAAGELQGESAREIARVTAATVERANQLRSFNTPDLIRQGQLFALLGAPSNAASQLILWHQIALEVTVVDHTPLLTASPSTYHEQYGPHRTSRAMALVHLAMFEAANGSSSTAHKYKSYLQIPIQEGSPSAAAAIIEAAYEVLSWLYPGLQTQQLPVTSAEYSLRRYYETSLAALSDDKASIQAGQAFGRRIATTLIEQRRRDGSDVPEPSWNVDFVPLNAPGKDGTYPASQWQSDPVSKLQVALGGRWSAVKPFVMFSANQFRKPDADAPPIKFATADPKTWDGYQTLLQYGGDTRLNTPGAPPGSDQYFTAKFWAYDATSGLCAPVRLYNQIADEVLKKLNYTEATDIARYYALVNLALADAGIGAWESKYYFQFARPVTAIRYQKSKDNPGATEEWYPLGAQATNADQTYNITPPFPSYPSGHAVFGGALFQVLRKIVPGPNQSFTFLSDEFNGKNKDVYNFIRCKDGDVSPKWCKPVPYTFDSAEMENAESRVYMGVHWEFDARDGIKMGNDIGSLVVGTVLVPE
jgi:PAP2 superfamily